MTGYVHGASKRPDPTELSLRILQEAHTKARQIIAAGQAEAERLVNAGRLAMLEAERDAKLIRERAYTLGRAEGEQKSIVHAKTVERELRKVRLEKRAAERWGKAG